MDLKTRNTNKRNQQALLNGFLYLICIFCATLVGCNSESNIATVQPKQELIAKITERLHPKGFDAKQIEQPDTVLINPAGKKELKQVISLPKTEAAKNNNSESEYK